MPQRSLSWKEESIDSVNFTVVLFYEIAAATPTFSNHHPDQSAAINIEARPSISKKDYKSLNAQMMVSIF
jgi:hypothetical protein